MTDYMRLALRLARRGYGHTSPNPLVGAVLVKRGTVIGQGWHHRAGEPHAEIEALNDAQRRGHRAQGATLFVTLEPCCTHGRTPPCTDALLAAGIRKVVVGATDPNPEHCGRAFTLLRNAGIAVEPHALVGECERLNEAFNHWIVHRTPFVTVKAAMTLDGKIATSSGESKWLTSNRARNFAMHLRQGSDAILVGINTLLADNPSLTVRKNPKSKAQSPESETGCSSHKLRRLILDSMARTPLSAKIISDGHPELTTIVVSKSAPKKRVAALAKRVNVLVAPTPRPHSALRTPHSTLISLPWLLRRLGSENVTSLLVEGGGKVNASFLLGGLTQRIAFFYAPKVLGGRHTRHAVAGEGATRLEDALTLREVHWRHLGPDLLLTARVGKTTGVK